MKSRYGEFIEIKFILGEFGVLMGLGIICWFLGVLEKEIFIIDIKV